MTSGKIWSAGDGILLDYTNAKLLGAIAGAAIGWWTKNLFATIICGMVVFTICQWLLNY